MRAILGQKLGDFNKLGETNNGLSKSSSKTDV